MRQGTATPDAPARCGPRIESLERRLLLAHDPSALKYAEWLDVPGAQTVVHDVSRHQLLVAADTGLLHRYDLRTRQFLAPWDLGEPLLGADISADGKYLYAGSAQRPAGGSAAGTIFKVRLDTGSVQAVRFAGESFEAGVTSVAAVGDGIYFTTRDDASSPFETTPVRRFDPSTGAVSSFGEAHIHEGAGLMDGVAVRSADRSLVLFTDGAGSATYEPATGKSWTVVGPGTGTRGDMGPSSYPTFTGADAAVSRDGSVISPNPLYFYDRDLAHFRMLGFGHGTAFDPQRDLVYMLSPYNSMITAMDPNTLQPAFQAAVDGPFTGVEPLSINRLPGDRVVADRRLYIANGTGVLAYRLFSGPEVLMGEGLANPGETVPVTVSATFPGGNVDPGYRGTVQLQTTDSRAEGLPEQYTFTPGDSGEHTFPVTFHSGGIQRVNVTDPATGLTAEWELTIDTIGPAVTASAPDVPKLGSTDPGKFAVTFTDPHGVDPATIGDGDVSVTDPRGEAIPVRLVSVPLGTDTIGVIHQTVTANYEIAPPGGRWDPSDRGTYTARLSPEAVADVEGNLTPAGAIATFEINVPATAPDLVVSAAADWSELAYVSQRVKVTATVRNLGTAPATGQTMIELVASEDALVDPNDVHLAYSFGFVPPEPGEAKTVEIEFAVPSVPRGGLYHLLPTVSNAGDMNPANNAGDGPVVPLAAPYADPVITVQTQPPPEARRGSVVAVRVMLNNLGSMPARGGWGLQLFRNVTVDPAIPRFERVVASVKRLMLKRGGSRAMTFRLKLRRKVQPGTYVLAAGFGPADSLSDWNRDNSVVAGPLRVTD